MKNRVFLKPEFSVNHGILEGDEAPKWHSYIFLLPCKFYKKVFLTVKHEKIKSKIRSKQAVN
jgi:hypothetical protein